MPAETPLNPGDPDSQKARDSVSRRRAALRPTAADHRGMDQAMRALSYLIAGVVFWGGLGWLGDYLLKTGFLLPIGIILGAGLGIYMIIRRYGQYEEPTDPPAGDKNSPDTKN